MHIWQPPCNTLLTAVHLLVANPCDVINLFENGDICLSSGCFTLEVNKKEGLTGEDNQR